MMSLLQRLILHRLFSKIFLCALAGTYVVYLVAFAHVVPVSLIFSSPTVVVHPVSTSPDSALAYWTPAHMRAAINDDVQISTVSQQSSEQSQGQAAKQQGQPPSNGDSSYPLSTVGKVFLTSQGGQDFVCSGTAVTSDNKSVVDSAGHCLYMNGQWVKNVIFCPLYDTGKTPYGCWAARDLEVPSDWLNPKPNDYHHDFGIAVVAANNQGSLTDVVGGAGWAYNQPANQPFSAYGYPAGYPFDGQTRQSCEASSGTLWPHGDGTVVSIPCDMTGGSSGGPWFIKIDGNWYLNGHNDFISSLQPKHMFSPYYDDTWYALYDKAQHT